MSLTWPEIDIIIPLYKPTESFLGVLDALCSQTVRPSHIWLINTEKAYFDHAFGKMDLAALYPEVRVLHLAKEHFDHGGTRRAAVKRSGAPVFVMMTQDAIPASHDLIENLVTPLLEDPMRAVSYGRQLAGDKCGVLEQISREFNYPEQSADKKLEDLEKLGVKTFFCSDVCAAYRREIYEKLGGFVHRTIFNEDMIYAASAVRAGYTIHYAADAGVYHYHNYTNAQQLRRNFDLGVSQAQHPEVFAGLSSESEGKKLVKTATAKLVKSGRIWQLPHFYMQCACKYAGYLLGKHYRMLPKALVLKLTTMPGYFRRSGKKLSLV